ncbi:hypothetical protein JXL19_07450 [bacterium]|nr:hypothetical protein [bacterium]
MLRPAQMARVDIRVPQDYIARTTCALAGLKRLHIINVRKMRLGKMTLDSHEDSNLIRKYTELKGRLKDLSRYLKINPDAQLVSCCQTEVNPHDDIYEIDSQVQQLEERVSCLKEEVDGPKTAKREKQELLRRLEIFSRAGIDVRRLNDCRYFYSAAGLIPGENLWRLELSLSYIYHQLIPSISIGKRRLVFIFGSLKDREKIEKALKSAYFEKVDIPCPTGSYNHDLEILKSQIQELETQGLLSQETWEKERKEIAKELMPAYQMVMQSLTILEIGKSFDKLGNIYHICGWTPQAEVPILKKKVLEATNQQARVSIAMPGENQRRRGELFKIPTCFQNPLLLKPFERLVSEYGIPSYGEVDPTFFFALSFLFMFGVMFGDIGHGLALFACGLFIFRKSSMENIRETGLIIMECGLMSAIFGVFYGSIFGFEHLIPALWFNPMQNIPYFMKVTIGFGIIIISIGLILNIINSIMNNDYKKGILGEFGIMGLMFYWGCIGLMIFLLTTGNTMAEFGYMLVILGLPLLVIFLKEPLFNLYNRIVLKERQPILPENLGVYLMESLIEVGDAVLGYLSNTVSFIRISAFALAHAGLFMAVFALADTLRSGSKGGFLWYWMTIVLGNIAIIVIEGVVVSIQTIRLGYYEFFSKFFKGGGEIYKPLRI